MASDGRHRCGQELLSLAHAGHLSGLKVLFAKVVLQLLECAVPSVVLGGMVELWTAPGLAGLGWAGLGWAGLGTWGGWMCCFGASNGCFRSTLG